MDMTATPDLSATLQRLREAWQAKKPDLAQRRDDLQRLREALKRRLPEMADTIAADFGHRSRHESLIADGMTVLNEIDHLASHLRGWMKPRRVGVGWRFWPARAEIRREPVGVVGVISPWNYPVNLALIPLATAIAAGNHVYLKPSEHTPHTTAFLRSLLAEVFPLDQAAARLATGKWFNGGQTCIAPDYVLLVGRSRRDALVQALREQVAARYGNLSDAGDFTRIINDGQFARLEGYLEDARARGHEVVALAPAHDRAERLFAPSLVIDPGDGAKVMQDEIFGPILPIRTVGSLDEAIAYVNARDRPLALYPFSHDRKRVERILHSTLAGGITVNDTVLHFGINALPFGGIGPSGMGAYHGRAGFDAMSKALPVLWQPRWAGSDLLKPPYSKVARFIDFIIR